MIVTYAPKLITMDISLNAFVLIDIWSIPMLIHNLYKIQNFYKCCDLDT